MKIALKMTLSSQVVISSIMCGYNKDDWTVLAKMAEVRIITCGKKCASLVKTLENACV